MKNYAILLLLALSLSTLAQSGSSPVRRNMAEQEEAWNRGDIAAFMQHYWKSDSLMFIGGKSVTYGWQKTLDNYKKAYPTKEAMGILKFSIVQVTELSPELVFVAGKWDLQKEKPAGGNFTLLWRLFNGRWVIVVDHTS